MLIAAGVGYPAAWWLRQSSRWSTRDPACLTSLAEAQVTGQICGLGQTATAVQRRGAGNTYLALQVPRVLLSLGHQKGVITVIATTAGMDVLLVVAIVAALAISVANGLRQR